MSSRQAAQQIANLLTQAGVPAGHSLDVAQRLLSMANSGPVPAQGSRSIDSTAANNAEFFNKYKTDEQNARDGAAGKAGKDGLPGYGGRGVDGRDGIPGVPGTLNINIFWDVLRPMIEQLIQDALAAFLTNLLNNVLTCTWFVRKFQDCVKDRPGGGSPVSDCPKCCNRESLKQLRNQDICSLLLKWWPEIAKIENLRIRVRAIERDLADTTDCEA